MSSQQTPATATPTAPTSTPRTPGALANRVRATADEYDVKARDIMEGDGQYGGMLTEELIAVLRYLAAELDRYQDAAVGPATALLTPCTPPDTADGECHPGESWPCSRTEAAWALRGWDADAQVAGAVRRWRFRNASAGREG